MTGPTGSSTWTPTDTFNEDGWGEALRNYERDLGFWQSGGRYVPDRSINPETGQVDPNAPQIWEPFNIDQPVRPNREDFSSRTWTQSTTLSPAEQAIFDQNQQNRAQLGGIQSRLTGNVADQLSTPRALADAISAYQRVPGPTYDDSSRQRSEAAVMDFFNRNQEPVFQRQADAERGRLLQMGFSPEDRGGGYSTAMEEMDRRHNNARLDAANRAIITGGSEGRADHAMRMRDAEFAASDQLRALAQQLTQTQMAGQDRTNTLNELQALRGGAQVAMPTPSGSVATPGYTPADPVAGAAARYGADMQRVNADNANTSGLWSGLLSLAGTAVGAPWLGGLLAAANTSATPQYQASVAPQTAWNYDGYGTY